MKTLITIIASIGIACTLYGIYLVKQILPDPIQTASKVETFLPFAPEYVLNKENVYREIMRNDIKFSDIVLRQSIIESGWYKSHNCLVRNNLFGMTGGNKTNDNIHGYAIYPNWMESVKAYKRWQEKRLTPYWTDYYQFLIDWSYAESTEYVNKLKSINLIIVRI